MFGFVPVLTNFAAACAAKGFEIIPTWYEFIDGAPDVTGRCALQFTFPDDVGKIALAIVDILLRIGAFVAIGYIIYGGFQYILSQGQPDKFKEAQNTIKNALIGLVIAMLATGIVTFIGNQFI